MAEHSHATAIGYQVPVVPATSDVLRWRSSWDTGQKGQKGVSCEWGGEG